MKITRDELTGAMYIAIREGEVAKTIEIESNNGQVLADVDDEGKVLGVEILGRTGALNLDIPEQIAVEQHA